MTITIDFKQATELLDAFGGEPAEITLINGDGHSGPGLYAYYADQPQEGAIFLGVADEEAVPGEYPECSGDPDSCPENEGYGCCKSSASRKQVAAPAMVTVPTSADEAACMALLGMSWLQAHAPERLTAEYRAQLADRAERAAPADGVRSAVLRLQSVALTLRATADRGRDQLGDGYPEVLQALGAVKASLECLGVPIPGAEGSKP